MLLWFLYFAEKKWNCIKSNHCFLPEQRKAVGLHIVVQWELAALFTWKTHEWINLSERFKYNQVKKYDKAEEVAVLPVTREEIFSLSLPDFLASCTHNAGLEKRWSATQQLLALFCHCDVHRKNLFILISEQNINPSVHQKPYKY